MEEKFKKMSIWGWGLETFPLSPHFFSSISQSLASLGFKISEKPHPLPLFESLSIPAPRFLLPKEFTSFCSQDKKLRLRHTYGKSTREIIKALQGIFENVPDYIAFPREESQIFDLMQYCSKKSIAIVPFGGGSSVVGGINVTNCSNYNGTLVINLLFLDKLLLINPINQTATFQSGIYGPDLERALAENGYTFRNYPQSFEFSTLGGWVSTHSGGHFATGRTHIDESVENLRIVTPVGTIETKPIPPDGAGPYHNSLFLGSEGVFGIITQVTLRVLRPQKFRLGENVLFEEFEDGILAMREICQLGITPANCRIFDKFEAFGMGIGYGNEAVLLLGFESAVGEECIKSLLGNCLEICKKFRGFIDKKKKKGDLSMESDSNFRDNFTKAPYLRNELLRRGIIIETLETVIPWDKFKALHEKISEELYNEAEKLFQKAVITCRITHCYSDGLAPYYTIIAQMDDLKSAVDKWDCVKNKANKILVEMGASITHHHAVGRDHLEGLKQMTNEKILGVFKGIKEKLDPQNIMNPGVLFK